MNFSNSLSLKQIVIKMNCSDTIALTTRLTSDRIGVCLCSFGLINKTDMLSGSPCLIGVIGQKSKYKGRPLQIKKIVIYARILIIWESPVFMLYSAPWHAVSHFLHNLSSCQQFLKKTAKGPQFSSRRVLIA